VDVFNSQLQIRHNFSSGEQTKTTIASDPVTERSEQLQLIERFRRAGKTFTICPLLTD
jgi:hypothetical protein